MSETDPEVLFARLLLLINSKLYPQTKKGFLHFSPGHAVLGPLGDLCITKLHQNPSPVHPTHPCQAILHGILGAQFGEVTFMIPVVNILE